ncbi:MAG: thermonuclease family protein [Hyphomicrobiales bacterium]|nr:thermonuclease family protein [Hyphomicrobiales bacterium]
MKRSPAHHQIWRLWAPIVSVLALAPAGPAVAACGATAGAVTVAAVTDRLELQLADGRLARLAGLDLPEPRRGDPATAAAARTFLAARLADREATLVIFSPRPDRWGRLLADIDLPGEETATNQLISHGFARVRPEFETRGCAPGRLAVEAKARAAGLGLWNDPDYSILDAADGEELAQQDGRFVIVEGAVRRVGAGRSRFYLDFGGRGGFTVVVARKSQSAFQAAGASLTSLAGERIRVRGVLDDRFGPRLEITEAPMLERLGRAGASQGTKPGG